MKKVVPIVAIVLAVLGVGALGYLYYDARQEVSDLRQQVADANKKIEDFKSDPNLAAQEEVNEYVEAVSKLYSLPDDEEPSVATVSDKSKLADQPFFEKAENGDVTLIYTQNRLAILYRPSTNQIVNVSTVTVDDNAGTTNQQDTEEN